MLANFEMTLSCRELIKRAFNQTMKDDPQGPASQLAYYFFLALFPALLCLIAIASFLPLLNFAIEHSWPWSKAPGEKVPGEKKKLGLLRWSHAR